MFKFNFVLFSIIFPNFALIKGDDISGCKIKNHAARDQVLVKILNDFEEIRATVNDLYLKCEKPDKSSKESEMFDDRFDKMPRKCHELSGPNDCASATQCTQRSGIYKIHVKEFSNESFMVACDAATENGDWLVIQKRQDGSENFFRNWIEYQNGFGDIHGEFFIGLDKLHALTNFHGPQELLIVMEDENYTKAFAKYDSFAIGNETESYKLKRIGKYSGNAGNSLQRHIGIKFTTKDNDNDLDAEHNCAVLFTGAWWYASYYHNLSNLNGQYSKNILGFGISWNTFCGHSLSLPYVKMMIRRSRTV